MTPIPSSRPERFPWAGVALVWAVLCAFLFAAGAQLGVGGRFLDPDDTMRLVQVRDLLAGQGWFDLHQYRIDPPHSPLMHWSRLVDAPLAGVILLLTPLVGQASAETAAAIVIPLLTLAALVVIAARMAFRLFGRRAALISGLVCGMASLTMAQVRPMRMDHHGWQVVTVLLAASALLSGSARRGGWLAGLALAAGMSISLEVLPFAAAFGAIFALRWWLDRGERWWLVHYLAALAVGLAALRLLTRGPGDGTIYCDAIGWPHLVFFGLVAVAAAAVARTKLPATAALGLLAAGGGAALIVFATAAPQCVGSPFGALDPLVHDFWYVSVLEGQPLWKQAMPGPLAPLLQALVALGALAWLWRRAEGEQRRFWLSYGLLLCASLATGLMVWRSMAFTGALAVLPLAWLADRLIARLEALRGAPRAALRQAVVGLGGLMLLMPVAPIGFAESLFTAEAAAAPVTEQEGCESGAPLLDVFPRTTVFAPMDIGPDILANTRHSVVATAHHRAQASMHDVILAFMSPPDEAHAIVTAHYAGLLAICTSLGETDRYKGKAPGGLMAQLVRGKAPAWLQPVPVNGPAGFKVWRVVG